MGAVSFHGPVRDGKGWFQDAMDTRLKGEGSRGQRRESPGDPLEEVKGWVVMRKVDRCRSDVLLLLTVIGSSRTGN